MISIIPHSLCRNVTLCFLEDWVSARARQRGLKEIRVSAGLKVDRLVHPPVTVRISNLPTPACLPVQHAPGCTR